MLIGAGRHKWRKCATFQPDNARSLLFVRTGYLIDNIRGFVRPDQAIWSSNRHQPARRLIQSRCASHAAGMEFRIRSSSRSPAGWRPARIAR